ncbi:MAG: diguanylate cyclase [Methylotenera sp.]|nr:diguanylate cyclase [Methylotenera sp.]
MWIKDYSNLLLKVRNWQLRLMSVFLALVLTLPIVACVELMLTGEVTRNYMITAIVASILVSYLVSGMLISAMQLNAQLRQDNQQLKHIINACPVPIAINDKDGNIMSLNLEFIKTFGYTLDDIPTLSAWWPKAYPDQKYRASVIARWSSNMQLAKQNKLAFEPIDINIFTKDKHIKSVVANAVPLDDQSKGTQIVTLFDITERKNLENSLWLMKSIIDKCKTAYFILDPEGRFVFVNDFACEFIGYRREELITLSPWHIDPDFTADMWPDLWVHLKTHGNFHMETRIKHKLGTLLNVLVSGSYISSQNQEYSFIFAQDITERKKIDTELRIAAAAFESQEGMIVTDAQTMILKINHAFTRITGFTPEEAVGKKMNLLKSGVHGPDFYKAMWDSITNTGSWQGEIWNKRKNGEIYPEWLTITAVKDANNAVTHYVGTMIDITARKAIEERVHHLAHYDVLTDLPNRTLLSDRLHQALAQARREKNRLALMFLDLDNFKPVNDTLGHDVGDLLLKEVALRLEGCVKRETDTVSRVGGDEFVIILSHIEAEDDAANVAEAIIENLTQPFFILEHIIHISCSIGIGIFPMHGADTNELLRVADNAMYEAKRAGRGCFKFHDTEISFVGDGVKLSSSNNLSESP